MSYSEPRPLVLFIDFDETITEHDTLSLIAPPNGTHPGPDFSTYVDAYVADLKAHEDSYSQDRSTLAGQLTFLESLDEIELTSQKRIEDGGLFVGFDPVKMEERAKSVRVRRGWKEVMARPAVSSLEAHIVSVGWSARFIEAVLDGSLKPNSICANEVEIDVDTGKGTGRLTKSHDIGMSEGRFCMRIAKHKTREIKRILGNRRGDVLSIYAGDSNTDLPSLLEADVGLILGDGTGIKKTLERLGLASSLSASIDDWRKKRQEAGERQEHDLVAVSDWFEAAQVIEAVMGEGKKNS